MLCTSVNENSVGPPRFVRGERGWYSRPVTSSIGSPVTGLVTSCGRSLRRKTVCPPSFQLTL